MYPSAFSPSCRYQRYLESVIEVADEYGEVSDLLLRHATLQATNQDLKDHQRRCAEASERTRADLQVRGPACWQRQGDTPMARVTMMSRLLRSKGCCLALDRGAHRQQRQAWQRTSAEQWCANTDRARRAWRPCAVSCRASAKVCNKYWCCGDSRLYRAAWA